MTLREKMKKMFEGVLYEKPLPPLPTTPLCPAEPTPLAFRPIATREVDEAFTLVTEEIKSEPLVLDPKVERDGFLLLLQNADAARKFEVFSTIPDKYHSDSEIMLEAAKHINNILQWADDSLTGNPRFMEEAIRINPENVRYASRTIRDKLEEQISILNNIIQVTKEMSLYSPQH
ncbi:hypothetical protein AWB71_02560 [Caballeronia peredens]|nr:hypothetical protein AWB71_02560 [Caballeronia peredens]